MLADAELITPCGGCRQRPGRARRAATCPCTSAGPRAIRGRSRSASCCPGLRACDLPEDAAVIAARRGRGGGRHPRADATWSPRRDRPRLRAGGGRRCRRGRASPSPTPSCRASPSATSPATPGRLHLGTLAGVPVAILQGRAHLYEGVDPAALRVPVRTLRASAPSCCCSPTPRARCVPEVGPGRLMALTDHINLMGVNPLVGPNDEAVGPRFVAARRALRRGAAPAAARGRGGRGDRAWPTACTWP